MSEEIKEETETTEVIENPTVTPIVAHGIKLPPLHATGSLTVDPKENDTKVLMVGGDFNAYEVQESEALKTLESDDESTKEVKKWEPVLPEMNTIFSIGGHRYRVCYINDGKGRFSAIPCK